MFDINAGRWADAARQIFGLQGPAQQLDGTIRASVALASDRPEFAFNRGEILWSEPVLTQAAVAVQRQSVGIANRLSRTLIVVTGLRNTSGTVPLILKVGRLPSTIFELGITSDQAGVGILDQRWNKEFPEVGTAPAHAVRRISRSNAAPVTGVFLDQNVGVGELRVPSRSNIPIAILPPQSYLMAEAAADNLTVTCAFFGYSVPLITGERG